MTLDNWARVRHMLDAAETAQRFVENENRASLDSDLKLVYAIVRAVEIPGGAASKVTSEFRAQYPQIPWPAIIGMRNRIVHAYFDVDLDQVWSAVTEDLPPLIAILEKILESHETDEP